MSFIRAHAKKKIEKLKLALEAHSKLSKEDIEWLFSLIEEMDAKLGAMQDSIYESWGDDN